MLSKSHRLSTAELEIVMEKGRVIHSSLFLARIFSAGKTTKISAVSPRKTFPTAVSRNSVRRKIYAAVSKIGALKAGNNIVLIAKGPVAGAAVVDAADDLKALFVKAGLLV